MKQCKITKSGKGCGLYKNENEFHKSSKSKDGYGGRCKSCKYAEGRIYRKINKENIKKEKREYRKANKEKIADRDRNYYKKNKEKIRAKQHLYYEENKEWIYEYIKEWCSENKEHVKENRKKYYQKNKETLLEKANERTAKRIKNDLNFKLSRVLRSRLYKAVKGLVKAGSAIADLGCSIDELKIHLEKQFYTHSITGEVMSWDNYGLYGWHIDHVIPLIEFDLTDREQFLKAANYTNLQPLWAEDNINKADKLDWNKK